MAVKLVPALGYCHGVQKVLRMAEEALADPANHPVYSYGSLIHNDQEIRRLEGLGLRIVDSLEGLHGGTLIIRAHGVVPEVFSEAERQEMRVLDGTCSQVRRAQKAAMQFLAEGRRVILYGDRRHPETIGIVGTAGGAVEVIESYQEAETLPGPIRNLGLLCQTTKSREVFQRICRCLLERSEDGSVVWKETACPMVWKRQGQVRKVALESDIMVVVGGRHSSNTRRLAETCEQAGAVTYLVETAEDLQPQWFGPGKTVGLAAGVSTPIWLIERIAERLEELMADALSSP